MEQNVLSPGRLVFLSLFLSERLEDNADSIHPPAKQNMTRVASIIHIEKSAAIFPINFQPISPPSSLLSGLLILYEIFRCLFGSCTVWFGDKFSISALNF